MSTDKAREDLAYIRDLMSQTRQATYVSGGYFIVWGIAIGLGLIINWMLIKGMWPFSPFISWTACLALGGAGTAWLIHEENRQPVITPVGRLIGMVWMSMGISMLIIFFIGVGSGNLSGEHMSALSAALVGGSVFLTGILAGLPWLRNLAFGWWVGSAVMFAWPGLHVLWLMGVMLLLFYVVPGIVLVRKKGTEHRD